MVLRAVRLDEKGRLLACPRCDNEELTQGAYCMICGIRLDIAARRYCGEELGYDLQSHQGE